MTSLKNVGVVIIGRNEGQRLLGCLRSLPVGTGPVVYVDSGSTDGSSEAARSLGAHVVQLDLAEPFTAARARNEGYGRLRAAAPTADFVQFLDGDCTIAPDWLPAAADFLRVQPAVAVVCGRRRERYPTHSVYNQLIDEEWNTPIGNADACGGDALVRVAAFEAIGGFDSALMAGEEPELCLRLRRAGWRIWRLDNDMTVHDAAIHRLRQWWGRAVRSGYGYAQVWSMTRGTGSALYGRELLRALIWAGAIPIVLLLTTVIFPPAGLAGVGVYALQIARVASRSVFTHRLSWAYASLMMLGKFAELNGAAKYLGTMMRGRGRSSIEYKSA